MDSWKLYHRACRYLNEGLIRTKDPPVDPARTRREWMESFLPDLGHPERAFEAVHVAGTSGKGSVATMIAEVLCAAGIPTGLHVSPYLQVATEKLWADGRYASADELAALVDWIRPLCEARRRPEVPLHGMASVGVALEMLRRSGARVGVFEAGVGGRNDLTNVLRTRVAVITALGLDHVKTLGPDLRSIAWHKAGIIRRGCRAVVLEGPEIVEAATEQGRRVGAELRVLSRQCFSSRVDEDGRTRITYRGPRLALDDAPLAMRGPFQGENAALALAALEALELPIEEQALRDGLGRARLPGRLELLPASEHSPCPVLLDGAHNPDKLRAMMSGLGPLRSGGALHVVYGALGSRAPDAELARLAALAETFTVTEPAVYQKSPRPAAEILAVVRRAGAGATAHSRAEAALDAALAGARPRDLVLVTGSLYLCGELRERWFPAREVVARRTSWW